MRIGLVSLWFALFLDVNIYLVFSSFIARSCVRFSFYWRDSRHPHMLIYLSGCLFQIDSPVLIGSFLTKFSITQFSCVSIMDPLVSTLLVCMLISTDNYCNLTLALVANSAFILLNILYPTSNSVILLKFLYVFFFHFLFWKFRTFSSQL